MIGYGEVGGIFGAALAASGAVTAYDIQISDASWTTAAKARAARDGCALASHLSEAIADSDLIISAVTAAQTAVAAGQIAAECRRDVDVFVLDVNSASPRTKRACAETVERSGARYVEAAMMSSVPPHGIRVPMLLGGPHATELEPMLAKLGFAATVGSASYGVVSAIKLCRSVIVKGMEALVIESFLTARRYGVEREVLASLVETFPGFDWDRQAAWFWRRVVQHGKRRAEEMREAAVAVADAGVTPRMAQATADVHSWIATLRAEGVFATAAADADWRELARLIMRETEEQPSRR